MEKVEKMTAATMAIKNDLPHWEFSRLHLCEGGISDSCKLTGVRFWLANWLAGWLQTRGKSEKTMGGKMAECKSFFPWLSIAVRFSRLSLL